MGGSDNEVAGAHLDGDVVGDGAQLQGVRGLDRARQAEEGLRADD